MKKMITLFILAAFSGYACAGSQVVMTKEQQRTLGITVSSLTSKTQLASQLLPASVVIPVGQEQVVSVPQPGLVDVLHVAAGQEVKKGQPVAHVSSPDLVGLQRDYLQALTQKKLAANTLQRDSELYQDGIIAQRRFLAAQSSHDELAAVLEQRRQALRLAGMGDASIGKLERSGQMSSGLTLTAPMDGQVLEQMASLGQRVDIATPLYRIAKLKPLWLEIHAPLEVLAFAKTGMQVTVPRYQASGRLIAIVRNVNKNDQTVHMRAEVESGMEKLSPGQFVEVQLVEMGYGQGGNRYSVPRPAVTRSGPDNYVFVQTLQGFEARKIEVVSEQADEIVISGKFVGNEKVATSGLAAIKGAWSGLGGE